MAYVANEREIRCFEDLHLELRSFIDSYKNQNGAKFVVPWNTWRSTTGRTEYYDFRIQGQLGPFKRKILTVSPPYTATDVSVQSGKFCNLGDQIKEEIAKFWRFGRHYRYKGEKEMGGDYKATIFGTFMSRRMKDIEDSPHESVEDHIDLDIESREPTREENEQFQKELESVAWEIERQRFEEFLESKN